MKLLSSSLTHVTDHSFYCGYVGIAHLVESECVLVHAAILLVSESPHALPSDLACNGWVAQAALADPTNIMP